MKFLRQGLAATAAIAAVTVLSFNPTAVAAPPMHDVENGAAGERPDALPNPAGDKLRAQKINALNAVLSGESEVIREGRSVGAEVNGKYVELGVEGVDEIFVITTEFGEEIDPRYGGLPGPLHNKIPKPDRDVDNSTIWQEDFNRDHYVDVYGSTDPDYPSLANFTAEQSGGKYTVSAQVSDWVQLDFNQARYGSNEDETETYWSWVEDSVEYWWNQFCQGEAEAGCLEQLEGLDQQDRYDYDADGNYQEPDGYIDHFQLIHAGVGEETGGGEYGSDAIWSHRWRVNQDQIGSTGPTVPGTEDQNLGGGAPIGDSGWWVADYTAQPENGGLGVFAHEYMHDLELPDLYATAGQENNTGFWTLMSSGSYYSEKPDGIIGDRAAGLSAWEKAFLGWITPDDGSLYIAQPGEQEVEIGPAAIRSGDLAQGAVVNVGDRIRSFETPPPVAGDHYWWSFTGDGLNTTLLANETFDLTGVAEASITASAAYDIESGCACDLLYAEWTTDDPASPNATWERLNGTVDGEEIWQDGQGLTGDSRGDDGELQWVPIEYDLSPAAGQANVSFRFHYATDGGLALIGFFFDELSIWADGEAIFADGGETGDNWTANGFLQAQENLQVAYPQRYWVENRQLVGADSTMDHSPYNFFDPARPDWVEHYSYEYGPTIWYNWDAWAGNNITSQEGTGINLPIDMHAEPLVWSDGTLVRGRIQSYDASLSLDETSEITLHKAAGGGFEPTTFGGLPAAPLFDDVEGTYYYEVPVEGGGVFMNGVNVEPTGTQIELLAMNDLGDGTQSATIRINAPADTEPTTPPTGSPTPTLPPTGGAGSSGLAGIGLAAVLAGGLLVAFAARRLRQD